MAKEIISENTRKIRRSLMAVSLIGFVLVLIDVSISKVTVLGTEFNIGNFEAIPIVLGIIIFYFWIAFIAYAFADYQERYRSDRSAIADKIIKGDYTSFSEMKNKFTVLKLEKIPELEQLLKELLSSKKKLDDTKSNLREKLNTAESKLKEFNDNGKHFKTQIEFAEPDKNSAAIKEKIEKIDRDIDNFSPSIEKLQAEIEKNEQSIVLINKHLEETYHELKIAKTELKKLREVSNFHKQTGSRLWDSNFQPVFRKGVELILPIAIGFIAMIVVFFFKEFKLEPTDIAKPKATIQTDKVITQPSPNRKHSK